MNQENLSPNSSDRHETLFNTWNLGLSFEELKVRYFHGSGCLVTSHPRLRKQIDIFQTRCIFTLRLESKALISSVSFEFKS